MRTVIKKSSKLSENIGTFYINIDQIQLKYDGDDRVFR